MSDDSRGVQQGEAPLEENPSLTANNIASSGERQNVESEQRESDGGDVTEATNTSKWRLTSASVVIEASDDELGFQFIDFSPVEQRPRPPVDIQTKSGRQQLRTACRELLLKYVDTFEDDGCCPPLSAYIYLATPCAKEFCLPVLQLVLELNLEPSLFSIETINWEHAQV